MRQHYRVTSYVEPRVQWGISSHSRYRDAVRFAHRAARGSLHPDVRRITVTVITEHGKPKRILEYGFDSDLKPRVRGRAKYPCRAHLVALDLRRGKDGRFRDTTSHG